MVCGFDRHVDGTVEAVAKDKVSGSRTYLAVSAGYFDVYTLDVFVADRSSQWRQDRIVPDVAYNVYMPTSVMSFRIDDDLKRRLEELSASTGRPAAFYVRQASELQIDSLENSYQIRSEAEAVRRGDLKTISSAELNALLAS